MFRLYTILIFIFINLISLTFTNKAHALYDVGYRSVSTWSQEDNMRLDVSLWYPTPRAPTEFHLDDYIMYAAKNGPILQIPNEELAPPVRKQREEIRKQAERDGLTQWETLQELKKAPIPFLPLPLIVFSHDSAASRFSNYPLAQSLASLGYLVAIPLHEKDNAKDMSMQNSPRALSMRTRQISATLDLLLSDKVLIPFIDQQNMTYVGFGSPSVAGLLLTGAIRTPTLWQNYCDAFESSQTQSASFLEQGTYDTLLEELGINDPNASQQKLPVNPSCVEPYKSNMDIYVNDLKIFLEALHTTDTYHKHITNARHEITKEITHNIDKDIALLKRQNPALAEYISPPPFILPYFPPFEERKALEDTRFARMVFISPAFSYLFTEEDLKAIDNPLLFIGLENATDNLPIYQSEVFTNKVNADKEEKNAEHILLSGTDIWGLQASCPPNNKIVEICNTVSEEKRTDLVYELTDILTHFIPNIIQ